MCRQPSCKCHLLTHLSWTLKHPGEEESIIIIIIPFYSGGNRGEERGGEVMGPGLWLEPCCTLPL